MAFESFGRKWKDFFDGFCQCLELLILFANELFRAW